MARSSKLPRDAARAVAPIVLPLVTKVALPLLLESMRRRKFDGEQFLREAGAGLKKGLAESAPEFQRVGKDVEDLSLRALEQGTELIERLATRGSELAEEWMDAIRPPRRRRRRWGYALGILAILGVSVALINRR
jgi:hypothetical protein